MYDVADTAPVHIMYLYVLRVTERAERLRHTTNIVAGDLGLSDV